MTRAIDCLVNVDMGDAPPPEWLVRVKEDTFKAGGSFLRSPELPELLDDMDANGVARAILLTRLGKGSDRAQRYAAQRPDRFSLGVGGMNLLRPMPALRDLAGNAFSPSVKVGPFTCVGEAAEIANAVVDQFRRGSQRQQQEGIDRGLHYMRMKVEECEKKVAELDVEYRVWVEKSAQSGHPVNDKDNLRYDELSVYRDLLKKLRTRMAETEIELVRTTPASSIEIIDPAIPALRRQVWRN